MCSYWMKFCIPFPLESLDLKDTKLRIFVKSSMPFKMAENGKNIVPLNGKTMALCALLVARGRTNASKNSVPLRWNLV